MSLKPAGAFTFIYLNQYKNFKKCFSWSNTAKFKNSKQCLDFELYTFIHIDISRGPLPP